MPEKNELPEGNEATGSDEVPHGEPVPDRDSVPEVEPPMRRDVMPEVEPPMRRPELPVPRVIRTILTALLDARELEVLLSEWGELYRHRTERDGEQVSRRWLRREARRAVFHVARNRLSGEGRPSSPGVAHTAHQAMGELRYALRRLIRAPVFALTVIVTVAIGIGGTTGAFSLVHGVILSPLPYPEADDLVRLYTSLPTARFGLSAVDFLAIQEQQTSFSDVAAYRSYTGTFTTAETSERVAVRTVTPGFLTLLRMRPALGRDFMPADGAVQADPAVMLSHGFWRTRFGGDPTVIGQTLRLDGRELDIVAVLPRSAGPLVQGRDILTAYQIESPTRKGPFGLGVLARLRAGVAPATAQEELRILSERLFPIWQDTWSNREATWVMQDLKESLVGNVRQALFVVLGAVAFVLLIASTNAANLLVARGIQRGRELGLRAALGASKGRLLQNLLAESLFLAGGGALLGLLITLAGVRLAATAGADFIPRTAELSLSGPVLMFFGVVTLASLVLFGLVPALLGSRVNLDRELRASTARGLSPGARLLRRLLVSSQFAVTVPLLLGAGLLLGSLTKLNRVDAGFDPDGLLTARVSLSPGSFETREDVRAFWAPVLEDVRALPGVTAAGLGDSRPPREADNVNNFLLEDHPTPPGTSQWAVPFVSVTPEYFDALGTRLVTGRLFDRTVDESAQVAMVDETWARRFFAGPEDAVGRRFHEGGCDTEACGWWTVVGVVQDVRYTGLENAGEGTIYLNRDQYAGLSDFLVVRTAAEPLSVLPAIRRILRQADSSVPVSSVATGRELLRDAVQRPRALTGVVAAFAGIALVLSLVGVYGVMAYFVQQNRRDMGIRLALGSTPGAVAGLVMRSGLGLVLAGTVVGLGGALLLTRLIGGLLFQTGTTDPVVFTTAIAGLLVVAMVACYLPARRAAFIDPVETLRE